MSGQPDHVTKKGKVNLKSVCPYDLDLIQNANMFVATLPERSKRLLAM